MYAAVYFVHAHYCYQPSLVYRFCHNQVVTWGWRIQSHPSPTESVLWHNDCYDNHHLKPRVGGGEMSASRPLFWWSHFWLAGTTRSNHWNWKSGCLLHANDRTLFPNNYTALSKSAWKGNHNVWDFIKKKGSQRELDVEGGMAVNVVGQLWAQSLAVRAKWGF